MTDAPDALTIAAQLIQHYESCERKLQDGTIEPYLDPRGIPTIGWGNTFYQDDSRVTLADPPITQEQADALFRFVLSGFIDNVDAALLLPWETASTATPNQLAAFTSLAYNIGEKNFQSSSALRLFIAGDLATAAEHILLWNESGGVVLLGLQRRRYAERAVFLGAAVADAISEAEKTFP